MWKRIEVKKKLEIDLIKIFVISIEKKVIERSEKKLKLNFFLSDIFRTL
jgi:hypothetical protein